MKIGPYEVTGGAIIPYELDDQTDQNVQVDGDGGVVVTEVPFTHDFIRVRAKVSKSEAENIGGFLKNGMRYSAIPFVFIDDFGVSHLVRFWDKRVRRKFIASNIIELDLLFRIEV